MEIRDVRRADAEAIPRVARTSLVESYGDFMEESTIDEMVEEWYAPDRIADRMSDENDAFVVAADDGVVGFAQGSVLEGDPVVGEIHWLHVEPGERGKGIGVQLLGHLQGALEDLGAEVLRGLVLAGNDRGRGFYEDHGFGRRDERTVDVQGVDHDEVVYEKPVGSGVGREVVETITGPDGRSLFVNYSEPERGTIAPFYPTFSDDDLADRYGWLCGNCESVDNTMDSMGRIVCNECGNDRKATRWDAAYL